MLISEPYALLIVTVTDCSRLIFIFAPSGTTIHFMGVYSEYLQKKAYVNSALVKCQTTKSLKVTAVDKVTGRKLLWPPLGALITDFSS